MPTNEFESNLGMILPEKTPGISKASEADAECFREIDALLEEGWKFKGSFFQEKQNFRLVMSKEGEEDKTFYTERPYPKIVDGTGRAREIP